MNKKIQVQVFGLQHQALMSGSACGGCSSKHNIDSEGCGGCSSSRTSGCSGCSSDKEDNKRCCKDKRTDEAKEKSKTLGEQYNELIDNLRKSDVKDNFEIDFLDLNSVNILEYDNIRYLYDNDFESPYVIIDGIVRYYGGLSFDLIYKDIKELSF